MPAGGYAAVPWADVVSFAELHDANRSEALIWREWYARQIEVVRNVRDGGYGGDPYGSYGNDLRGTIGYVDTRARTRHLRERGAMRVGIFSGEAAESGFAAQHAAVLASPPMAGADLTADVTTPREYTVEPAGECVATVLAVDLGIKTMTPVRMAERGMRVHVLPAGVSPDDLVARARSTAGPVGVFFSNGPGDPAAADRAVAQMQAVLAARIPVFGICFGNQILGRALGFGTYKLGYGHRGINQPVADRVTGRVEVTAHNHGFAVDAPLDRASDTEFGRVEVSHVCLNDDVVEGLRCLDVPAFSVQYHPEAAAGPHDSAYLFDRFAALMGVAGPPGEHGPSDPQSEEPHAAAH